MATEGTSSYYAGAGGKFRKKPFRKPQTTPYDRPPTAFRNPSSIEASNSNGGGWISKMIVDPASKLINASAHLFFSSLFHKRLPAPPPPGANQESKERYQETVLHSPAGDQEPVYNDSGEQGLAAERELEIKESKEQTTQSDSSGLMELELMLKKKTFTRSEIDRLTGLLHSRTVDLSNGNGGKNTDFDLREPLSALGGRNNSEKSHLQEIGNENYLDNHKFHGGVLTAAASSKVLEEDVATPVELAKAYMGKISLKVSPSVLDSRSQTIREDHNALNNLSFAPRSPVTSIVHKRAVHEGVLENGFLTPRSRGRSAIYNMARTPFSRVSPTEKGNRFIREGHAGPSASSSSGFARELVGRSVSKDLALKRRSSVLDDEMGTVGPIRRLRQKTNLSTPSNRALPVVRTSLSNGGYGISKTSQGTEDNNGMPGRSYTPVPTQSKETARKILQQLQKLAPNDKSSEGRASALHERSPSKLTQSMLHGQALRSLEDVDSPKILQGAGDNYKYMHKADLPDVGKASSSIQDEVKENGLICSNVSWQPLALAGTDKSIVPLKETVTADTTAEFVRKKAATQPSQKKWAFQMSAHEDFPEHDDEIHSNEAATSAKLTEGKKMLGTPPMDSKSVPYETVPVDKASSASEFIARPDSSSFGKPTDLVSSGGTNVAANNSGLTSSAVPSASTLFQPAVSSSQSTAPLANIVPDEEQLKAPQPQFGSDTKNDGKTSFFTFASSSVNRSTVPAEVKPETANSLVADASDATESVPKPANLDNGGNKKLKAHGDSVVKPVSLFPLPQSTSEITSSILTSGSSSSFLGQSNGSLSLPPPVTSSPLLVRPLGNSALPNPFNSTTNSTASSLTMDRTAATAASTDVVPSTSATLSSPPITPLFNIGSTSSGPPSTTTSTTPIFKFGSSAVEPSSSFSTVSNTSSATGVKASTEDTTFGGISSNPFAGASFPVAGSGSTFVGFSAGSTSSSSTSLLQGSSAGTQSMPVFGSSASPLASGTSASTLFTPSSSQFGNSSSASFASGNSSSTLFSSLTSSTSLFGTSTTSKDFASGSTFGPSTSAPSAETKAVNSNGPTSTLWPSPATGFAFGAASSSNPFGSSLGSSTAPGFSFGSTPAASSTQMQPMFGSSVPVFGSAPSNGDQMTTEDSMAEDPVQGSTTTTTTPALAFGQPAISNPSPGFSFGSTPFQFGGQPSQSSAQNPPPFQPSGSLEFGGGGSFSLGSGGGDKSNRRIVRVNRSKNRRK